MKLVSLLPPRLVAAKKCDGKPARSAWPRTLAFSSVGFFYLALILLFTLCGPAVTAPQQSTKEQQDQSIELSDTQLKSIKVEPVGEYSFPQEKQAVGAIDFNQELLTQIFTPYQGRIIKAYATVGERVAKDQVLFTIDSPDLMQAESTLITTAGVLELTGKVLERQRNLLRQSAAAQKDYEQAVSDQQTAEGAYRAARAAVTVFGKTEAEIDKIVADRKIDQALVVNSPILGLITARNAAPGLLVQPGNPPPVYVVADTSTMWMLANIPEKDIADVKVGDEVVAAVSSFPGRTYRGKIVTVGASVDANTRRVSVRSEIENPNYELRAGMFANFTITVAPPKRATAVPQDAVVREGDGSMTVWVTNGRNRFTKRIVKIGAVRDGFTEIVEGLQPGEPIATEGSLFISNQFVNAAR
jgi:membrane fusion protein, heavy metal efflux system